MSRASGADLLSRLQTIKARASVALVGFVVAAAVLPATAAPADRPPPANPVETERELAQAIRETLEKREYQWKLKAEDGSAKTAESGIAAMLRRVRQAVVDFFSAIAKTIRRWWDKLSGAGGELSGASGGGGINPGLLQSLIYGLSAIIVLLLILAVARWLRRRQTASPGHAATASLPDADLHDESTLASQLPEDQWLRLARENLAAGEARLAARAVFLATLAALGEQRLIEIARSKTNRDYRNELGRRARSRSELQEAFGENVGIFERVWYGLHEVGEGLVETLMSNYHRIKSGAPS
jgi:hypothetical protein